MTDRIDEIRWRADNGMYAYYAQEDVSYLLVQLDQALAEAQAEKERFQKLIQRAISRCKLTGDSHLSGMLSAALAPSEGSPE